MFVHDIGLPSQIGSTHAVEVFISSRSRGRRAVLTANSARGSELTGGLPASPGHLITKDPAKQVRRGIMAPARAMLLS